MKKIILSCLSVLCVVTLTAQTEFDAIKMSHQDISGTARYMGMAGAFSALGGDVSAIKDNPAGLGVYRSWEMTTTFNFLTQKSNSKWEGQSAYDDMNKFGFNNVALVMSFPTWNSQKGSSRGLLQSNWSFSYNRLKNFNKNTRIKGGEINDSMAEYLNFFSNDIAIIYPEDFADNLSYEDIFGNQQIPWISVLGIESGLLNYDNGTGRWTPFNNTIPSTASYLSRESGHIGEYSLSWGGNFSNKFYLGLTLNFTNINHTLSRTFTEFYTDLGEGMQTGSEMTTTGSGINMNIGLIYKPFDQFRLALSYKTPTLYSMTDALNYASMDNVNYSTWQYYDYELRTPGKLDLGAAYVIGKRAILSVDFVYTNYQNAKFISNSDYYDSNNDALKNKANNAYLIKVGGEYRLTDHVSIRAGFAAETAVQQNDMYKRLQYNAMRIDTEYFIHEGTNYFTAGLGYRGSSWYLDAAFVNKNLKERFMPYEPASTGLFSPAKVTTRNYDVVATIGFKF